MYCNNSMIAYFYRIGIVVENSIVVFDCEQGGAEEITKRRINAHSLFKITELLAILKGANRIDEECVKTVTEYISNGKLDHLSQMRRLVGKNSKLVAKNDNLQKLNKILLSEIAILKKQLYKLDAKELK